MSSAFSPFYTFTIFALQSCHYIGVASSYILPFGCKWISFHDLMEWCVENTDTNEKTFFMPFRLSFIMISQTEGFDLGWYRICRRLILKLGCFWKKNQLEISP